MTHQPRPQRHSISTTLPAAMLDRLRRIAAAEDRSVSAAVRRAITFYVAACTTPGSERDELVLQLRSEGLGYKRIAAALGLTRDSARDLVQRVERNAARLAAPTSPPGYPKSISRRSPDPSETA